MTAQGRTSTGSPPVLPPVDGISTAPFSELFSSGFDRLTVDATTQLADRSIFVTSTGKRFKFESIPDPPAAQQPPARPDSPRSGAGADRVPSSVQPAPNSPAAAQSPSTSVHSESYRSQDQSETPPETGSATTSPSYSYIQTQSVASRTAVNTPAAIRRRPISNASSHPHSPSSGSQRPPIVGGASPVLSRRSPAVASASPSDPRSSSHEITTMMSRISIGHFSAQPLYGESDGGVNAAQNLIDPVPSTPAPGGYAVVAGNGTPASPRTPSEYIASRQGPAVDAPQPEQPPVLASPVTQRRQHEFWGHQVSNFDYAHYTAQATHSVESEKKAATATTGLESLMADSIPLTMVTPPLPLPPSPLTHRPAVPHHTHSEPDLYHPLYGSQIQHPQHSLHLHQHQHPYQHHHPHQQPYFSPYQQPYHQPYQQPRQPHQSPPRSYQPHPLPQQTPSPRGHYSPPAVPWMEKELDVGGDESRQRPSSAAESVVGAVSIRTGGRGAPWQPAGPDTGYHGSLSSSTGRGYLSSVYSSSPPGASGFNGSHGIHLGGAAIDTQTPVVVYDRAGSTSTGGGSMGRDNVLPGEDIIFDGAVMSSQSLNPPTFQDGQLKVFRNTENNDLRFHCKVGGNSETFWIKAANAQLVPMYGYDQRYPNVVLIRDIEADRSAAKPSGIFQFHKPRTMFDFQARLTGEKVVMDIGLVRLLTLSRANSRSTTSHSSVRLQIWHEDRSVKRSPLSDGASFVTAGTAVSGPKRDRTTATTSRLVIFLGRLGEFVTLFITDDLELEPKGRTVVRVKPVDSGLFSRRRPRFQGVKANLETKGDSQEPVGIPIDGQPINADVEYDYDLYKTFDIEFENEASQMNFTRKWDEVIKERRMQREKLEKIKEEMDTAVYTGRSATRMW